MKRKLLNYFCVLYKNYFDRQVIVSIYSKINSRTNC